MVLSRYDIIFTGRVQGVFFRATAQEIARRYDVTGWVRNTSSGFVEAHVEGERKSVELLLDWLAVGPPSARVSELEEVSVEPIEAPSFQVLS